MSIYLGENCISAGGSSAFKNNNIGEIIQSTIPLSDAGLHLLDGALISGAGSYSAFVTHIAGLVSNYPDLFTTETAWQQSITDYGVCGKFVYDSVNNTVRLPKITGFTEGTIDPTVLGDLVQAGLPNITGGFSESSLNAPSQSTTLDSLQKSGAFLSSSTSALKVTPANTTSATWCRAGQVSFDASDSDSIYGNSSTVQPQAIKVLYYIVIATMVKTDIQVDIDQVATDLNGKADVDLTNVNSSGTALASGWAMPSSRYIDLTLGASGATYTAPANGYFCLDKAGTQNEYIDIRNNTTGLLRSKTTISAPGTESIAVYMPCKKGDEIAVVYTATRTTNRFRFIYAEGENV